ncbi:MAG: thiaminase II [Sporolactobacillus sp.]|jgi:thiaminase/transcriptional activator TenA|nr:thiaminase II [Sporolactobacillus sp.]
MTIESISDLARQRSNHLWEESFAHPFVQGIKSGALDLAKFRFYIKQDAYYVREFAKLHGRAAAQSDHPDTIAKLLHIGIGLAEGELQLHKSVFQALNISGKEWAAFRPAPIAYAYISHLYHVLAKGKLSYSLAALMPCPWLYDEVGEHLKDARPQAKVFQDWIAEYSGEDIKKNVRIERALWDASAENATEAERCEMIHIFMQSSFYELQFWEMGWTQSDWSFIKEDAQ